MRLKCRAVIMHTNVGSDTIAHDALDKAELPGIRHKMILSEADLGSAAEYVGFPAVLKPVSGCASLGVQKVTDLDDLVNVYRSTRKEFMDLVFVNGAFVHNAG
mmetsp:Transcript_15407/g.12849  ORF Transcript_15407/g.12849 Transcript_15407/m.12849 type:complete len:103 (-) Transcript_15407:536-844(-)